MSSNLRQLNWDDLRIFLALARAGTVRAAAERLEVSHATVARRIDQMERVLDAPLFDRRAGGPRLTQAGEDLRQTAQRMEEEVLGVQRRSFGQEQALEGPIVLTMIDALVISPVLGALEAFRAQNPKVELMLDVSLSLANLDRREADLALRFGESPAPNLVGRRLMKTARAVYASYAYVERRRAELLRGEGDWIGFTKPGVRETWKTETPFPEAATVLRMPDMRGQHLACRSGIGLALLPCFLCDPDPDLLRISAPEFPAYQTLWLLRHGDSLRNARVTALSEHLAAAFRTLLPLLQGKTRETDPL